MIKNYLKIAFRNLVRHKAFSIINITGLAIGIASCLLLFTVVKYELSYDKFQPNYKQIYHVVTEDKFRRTAFFIHRAFPFLRLSTPVGFSANNIRGFIGKLWKPGNCAGKKCFERIHPIKNLLKLPVSFFATRNFSKFSL